MQTYPEKTTFIWEEKERLPMSYAIDQMAQALRMRGTPQRKATYVAVVRALEAVQHEHDPDYISVKKLKAMLIAAAHEHGWYAQDMKTLAQRKPPLPEAPEGMKACRKCREIKPRDEFKAKPTPAKARKYGWKEDTGQLTLSHLCATCRKNNQQAKSRIGIRSGVKRKFDPEVLRNNPELARRVAQYQKLENQIRTHYARVRAAFASAKVAILDPEGTFYEYQFKTDALRQFYECKKALVMAAGNRLRDRFGEAAPLPDAWGMLLTREEQVELSNLHDEAVLSSTSKRKPSLWTIEVKDKDED